MVLDENCEISKIGSKNSLSDYLKNEQILTQLPTNWTQRRQIYFRTATLFWLYHKFWSNTLKDPGTSLVVCLIMRKKAMSKIISPKTTIELTVMNPPY